MKNFLQKNLECCVSRNGSKCLVLSSLSSFAERIPGSSNIFFVLPVICYYVRVFIAPITFLLQIESSLSYGLAQFTF